MIQWIWHNVYAQFGIGLVILLGCAAVGYLFPPLRRLAIEIGAGVIGYLAIYEKGVLDEKKRKDALQREAENKAVASGKSERAAAESDAASGVRDGYDRDK